MPKIVKKTPNEKLDCKFAFAYKTAGSSSDPEVTDYLATNEIISTFTISASPINGGSIITLSGSSLTDSNTSVLYWIEGGEIHYHNDVTCLANTSDGRKVERTMRIQIIEEK
jgi:hypothetical protein